MMVIERLAAEIVHNKVQVIDPYQQLPMSRPFSQSSIETFGSETAVLGEQNENIVIQQRKPDANEEGLDPNEPIVHCDDPA